MAIVGRILMVIIAYVLACIAASLVLTIGTLAPQWEQISSPDIPSVVLWSVVGVSAAVIAIVALLPSFLVIALAEGFAWRSIVLYGVLGGVLALALTYGIDFAGYVRGTDSTFAHEREVLAASGIAGGLVYWVFAGRKAGLWKL
jgi:putative copper export protein